MEDREVRDISCRKAIALVFSNYKNTILATKLENVTFMYQILLYTCLYIWVEVSLKISFWHVPHQNFAGRTDSTRRLNSMTLDVSHPEVQIRLKILYDTEVAD